MIYEQILTRSNLWVAYAATTQARKTTTIPAIPLHIFLCNVRVDIVGISAT